MRDEGYKTGMTIGNVLGCLAGIAFFFTLGVAIIFGVAWGCAHHPEPDLNPCGSMRFPVTLLLVILVSALLSWAVGRVLDWLITKVPTWRQR